MAKICYLLFLFAPALLSSPSSSYSCTPKCSGTQACTSSGCKVMNDALGTCATTADCADTSRGGCSANSCVCNSGYIWDYYDYECRLPNDGSGYCDNDEKCADQYKVGYCDDNGGKCRCNGIGVWVTGGYRCGITNNGAGTCSKTNQCYDFTRGTCQDGLCFCNANYLWDTTYQLCRAARVVWNKSRLVYFNFHPRLPATTAIRVILES